MVVGELEITAVVEVSPVILTPAAPRTRQKNVATGLRQRRGVVEGVSTHNSTVNHVLQAVRAAWWQLVLIEFARCSVNGERAAAGVVVLASEASVVDESGK